jgi:hypothetical protein
MVAKRADKHTDISYFQRDWFVTLAKRDNNAEFFAYSPLFLCVQKVKVF